MKIIEWVASVDTKYGGPAYSVPALSKALESTGINVELHTLYASSECININYQTHKVPLWCPSVLGYYPGMFKELKLQCQQADIIHTHLLWGALNVLPEFARRNTSCKHIISPRGTLSQAGLDIKSNRKKFFLYLGQKKALENADMLHATSQIEYEDIRRFGLHQPVLVLPNGIDLPIDKMKINIPSKMQTILYLSRFHPIKGIKLLLDAWRKIEPLHSNWKLRLVGPKNAYWEQMQKYAQDINLIRVEFVGEVLGDDKMREFDNASIFILPSFSENFGVAIAEALSYGVPVITTNCTPWQELECRNCGMSIDPTLDDIVYALEKFMQYSKNTLTLMGNNGKIWMKEFQWNNIGRQMSFALKWLIDKKEKPGNVRLWNE